MGLSIGLDSLEKKTSNLASQELNPNSAIVQRPITIVIELSSTGLTEMWYAFEVLTKSVEY